MAVVVCCCEQAEVGRLAGKCANCDFPVIDLYEFGITEYY